MPLAKFVPLLAFGAGTSEQDADNLPHVVMTLDYTKFLAKSNK